MDKYDANKTSKTNTIRFMKNERNQQHFIHSVCWYRYFVVAFVVIFLLFSSFMHLTVRSIPFINNYLNEWIPIHSDPEWILFSYKHKHETRNMKHETHVHTVICVSFISTVFIRLGQLKMNSKGVDHCVVNCKNEIWMKKGKKEKKLY